MAKTTGIEEASADLPRISNYVMRTDVPATMSMNDMPLVDVASASRDAVDVAAGFMDEYASLFDKLAKFYWGCVDMVSNGEGEMAKRYGQIYVDADNYGQGTMQRSLKDSYHWYKKCIESNGEDLD